MGRRFGLVLVGLSLALGLPARSLAAQYIYGIGMGLAAPTGDLSDVVGAGGGGTFFIGSMVRDDWMLKLEVGYWAFSPEEITLEGGLPFEVDGAVMPLRVGVRKFWGESKRFYTGADLGVYYPGGGSRWVQIPLRAWT